MKKTNGKYGKKINLFLTVYLFCFFFSPPVISVNINIIQAGISLIYMLLHESLKNLGDCMSRMKMSQFLKQFFLIVLYMLLAALASMAVHPVNRSNYINTFYGIFLFTVIMMINILFIIIRCRRLQFGLEDLLRHCVYAGLIQACIGIVMLVSPDIRQFLNHITVVNTGTGLMEDKLFSQVRGYAFSRNMVDVFGYGVGVLAGISFYFGMERKRRYLFYFVMLIVLTFLNARTGIIMAVTGIGVWVLVRLRENGARLRGGWKYLLLGSLLVIISAAAFQILQEQAPATAKWILRDMNGLFQKLSGKQVQGGTVAVVLFSERFWTLPGAGGLLFGTGHSIYGAEGYPHSDVGYVNLIWQIGIPGMVAMMLVFGNLFRKGYQKSRTGMGRWLCVYTALAFYIFQIKGSILSYTPGSAVTMLVIFSTIYFSRVDVMEKLRRKEPV